MKQKKILPVQGDSSWNTLSKVAIFALAIVVLFLLFSPKNTAPKIVPDTTKQTTVCSEESFPVCGRDGKTYTNSCTAEKIANVRVAYVGACRAEPTESPVAIAPVQNTPQTDTGIENTGVLSDTPVTQEGSGAEIIVSTGTVSESTASGMVISGSGVPDPTLITYTNNTYHYSFSMPKRSYYQAFGAQNGASHSVGIASGTGVDSLAASEVHVYFYANKVIEKLSTAENGFYTDSTTGKVYVLLNNKDSVMIESDNPQSTLVQTIIRTIHAE